jgi:hypothetical protein
MCETLSERRGRESWKGGEEQKGERQREIEQGGEVPADCNVILGWKKIANGN